MQDDRGLKAVLKLPGFYSLFQRLAGVDHARLWAAQECLRVRQGDKVIDIGCGPGDFIAFLPTCRYIGIDISAAYIREGQKRYGDGALFLHGTTDEYRNDARLKDCDLVICFGVLHHLDDDEVRRALAFAYESLRPGGRFVGLEPCRLIHQSWVSSWVMARDRGRNVRQERAWAALLQEWFPSSSTAVLTGLLRLPYTHIMLEGVK